MLIRLGFSLLLLLRCGYSASDFAKYSFNRAELNDYRRQVKELFYFAHDNYLERAYPFDELRPISCVPNVRNFDDPEDIMTNDVLGNFSVTLIDSLTTIAIFNDRAKFQQVVGLIESRFPRKFDLESTVQVFETTIRVVGGLISSHLYATDPSKGVFLGPEYDGFLLELARDMADRLLPAYLTTTGLPLARINLKHGVVGLTADMMAENNVAAMASPMFEFTMLSHLTNDEKYGAVARYAMNKTWALRSELDLLPMSFNPETGQCYSHFTGIGASIDSFYEYALKGAVLFNDEHLYGIWHDSFEALKMYCKADWFFVNAHPTTGQMSAPWVDSLSAFFPGLEVLAGDVEDAKYKNLMSLKLWDTFGGIPERWLFQKEVAQDAEFSQEEKKAFKERANVPLEWYPLRPEFVESTYFLYRATRDPFYLNIGVAILESFQTRFKYKCGFGGIQDVMTGEPQDRMETFVLSETLKYLYLLFDDDNEIHHTRDNVVFSTEAHPMWISTSTMKSYSQNKYFTDPLYLRHLEACRALDDQLKAKSNKRFFLKERISEFAKTFFSEDRKTTIQQSTRKRASFKKMCPVIETDTGPWQFSRVLNNFDRLFEIDHRYNDTLIKPLYLAASEPLEINTQFYTRWADQSHSSCRAPATTTSFELIMDMPGRGQLEQLPNGSISSDTLSGRWKFRIEKLQPGLVDIYGQEITSALFETADCKNIFKPSLPTGPYSPTLLYRITALNGMQLPSDGQVVLNRTSLLEVPETANILRQLFGYTPHHQLMFESTPIINLYLA